MHITSHHPGHARAHGAFVELSTGQVHYRELGRGHPLILLHANPGDSRDFEAVMPALARHHRVIALDWPGCGRSSIPDGPHVWNALSFRSVLLEFMDRLGLPRACFIGNSLGGNVAAWLAIEAPERVAGLVLVSPGGFTPHNAMTRGFCRMQGSRFALPPRVWAAMCLRRRNAWTRAMLARAAGEQSMPERKALNRAVWRSFAHPAHDLRAMAGRIACPALLVFGRDDPAIPARRDGRQAQRCMPSAVTVALPCGHAPFAEMPDDFLRAVQPFLLGVPWDAEASADGPGALASPPACATARSRLR